MSKQKNNWKDPEIKAKLIELVEGSGGVESAAKHFKVPTNIISFVYNRRNGDIPARKLSKKVAKKQIKPALRVSVHKKNPFQIMNDLEHSGNRATSAETLMLKDQVMKLDPNDLRTSVNIPATICKTRANAQNLAQNVRNILAGKASTKNIVIVTKGINDAKGVYVGTRVWRIK